MLIDDFEAAGTTWQAGTEPIFFESSSVRVALTGEHAVFDLTVSDYKTTSTNWEFRASLADLNSVSRLAFIMYPAKSGAAYLDNVYLSNTP